MEELIQRARAGDGSAFVELMESQKGTMYKVARSYLHNDIDAADAISETVLTCFEKLDTLRQPQYFRTWLTRILIRKCQDILRERKRSVPLEEVIPVGCAESGHARVEFLDLLDSLDEKYRTVSAPFQNVIFRRNGMSLFAGWHTCVMQPYTPANLPA